MTTEVRPLYDSKTGILGYLADGLAGLNELERARHQAGYKRQERLQEFCILGRWMTDSCGNFGKIIGDKRMSYLIPAEILSDCPRVATREEISKQVERIAWDGASSHIPHPGMICELCQEAWTLENAHDAVQFNDHVTINCEPFVGIELELFERSLISNVRDTKLFGEFLRNDRFIDKTPMKGTTDVPKNRNGWVERSSLPKNYRFHEGDEINATYFYWRHPRCHQLAVDEEARQEMQSTILKAGFVGFSLTPIKNGYWGDPNFAVSPWFIVESQEMGKFTIGWRKRVINIDWSESEQLKSVDTLKLFEKENVTKETTLIHAWGYEKAVEYLTALRIAAISPQEGP